MALASRRGFSANIAMLFVEHGGILERLRRARAAGFDAVEISTNELYDHSPGEVASVLDGEGLRCVLFNMHAGAWGNGERGIAALPSRRVDFERSVETAMEYAVRLNCPRVHCLAGLAPVDSASELCYRNNLALALSSLGSVGVDVLIEPINERSMPGYHLCSFAQAADTIVAVPHGKEGHDRLRPLKLLFDIFHCQRLHGDLSAHLRLYRDIIGHVQIAGVPDRGEPDANQEVNYPNLIKLIRGELAYTGHIGCEYIPRSGTEAGLRWLDQLHEVE